MALEFLHRTCVHSGALAGVGETGQGKRVEEGNRESDSRHQRFDITVAVQEKMSGRLLERFGLEKLVCESGT